MVNSIYLAGPIEFATDFGWGWRTRLTPALLKAGWKVLDPLNDHKEAELGFKEGKDFHSKLNQLRADGNVSEIHRLMTVVRDIDLHTHIDSCSHLLLYLPHRAVTCGSWEEIGYAWSKGKTTYLVAERDLEDLPLWAFACAQPEHIFVGLDNLIKHLKKG